ncbi:MAG TPA: hypothetical protein ENH40_05325 [Nitrospirae bacterium]|nr:hypothetical protein [Nitrospirota bacterium]
MQNNLFEKQKPLKAKKGHADPCSISNALLCDSPSLLNGVTEIIESWEATTPAQVQWKKQWLADAYRIINQETVCNWEQDEMLGYWQTQCGEIFEFMNDGPKENHMNFCPYCGDILIT